MMAISIHHAADQREGKVQLATFRSTTPWCHVEARRGAGAECAFNTRTLARVSMGHQEYVVRIPRRVIARFSRDNKLASSHRISGLITT